MKVTGLTLSNCPKCEQAKQILQGYPVKWVNIYADSYWREEAKKLTDTAPFFIIGHDDDSITYTKSALRVKRLLDAK